MIATTNVCANVPPRNRQQPCGKPLTWARATAGKSEGHWLEVCFSCGWERRLNKVEREEAEGRVDAKA